MYIIEVLYFNIFSEIVNMIFSEIDGNSVLAWNQWWELNSANEINDGKKS